MLTSTSSTRLQVSDALKRLADTWKGESTHLARVPDVYLVNLRRGKKVFILAVERDLRCQHPAVTTRYFPCLNKVLKRRRQ